jgi:glycosyltransferase involved in cell wall biosynthesis
MASAIAMLVELQLGADSVFAVPTWRPGSHLRAGVLTARAVARVSRLPRGTAVHVHMSEGGSFLREAAVLASARLRGLPRVVTIHGYRFSEFAGRWPRLVRWALGMAGAVIVLSDSDGATVRRLVPQTRVELVPNAMPLDLGAGPVGETAEVVLFAGEVGTRKGADVLHRAWPIVTLRRPLATCVVVGPATGLNLPVIERFERRGPVSPTQVRELIREARVVTLPSRGEVLPVILAEAMAAGRPFVATPVGGVGSLAAGGILVAVDDEVALAEGLIELLSDPQRAQALGSAGRALCERQMAPEVVDARLRDVYAIASRAMRSSRARARSRAA